MKHATCHRIRSKTRGSRATVWGRGPHRRTPAPARAPTCAGAGGGADLPFSVRAIT